MARGIRGDAQTLPTCQHTSQIGTFLAKLQQGVFDHNHGPVDQEAEIERAEAHQISADAKPVHADDGEQEADRDHQRRNGCRTDVSEQQEQHDDDQQRSFGQVLGHGLDGRVDQCATVQDRLGHDIGWKAGSNLFKLFGGGLGHGAAVFSGQHQGGADNGLVAIAAGTAEAGGLTDLDRRHVGNPNHQTVAVDDGSLRQIIDTGSQCVGANRQGFTRPLHITGTGLCIGAVQCLAQIAKAQTIASQTGRIGPHGVFFDIAAVHIDARKTACISHARRDDPVLNRPQIGGAGLGGIQSLAFGRQIAAVRLPSCATRLCGLGVKRFEIDRPHQDFAQTGRDWRQAGFDVFGQVFARLCHPLGHLLAD